MIGDGTQALVGRALRATGEIADPAALGTIVKNAHQRFLKFYEAALTKLSTLYPGVASILASLVQSGARLAICTNKQQTATLAVLKGFGIGQYFEAVVGGDIVPFRKPDPRHLLAALRSPCSPTVATAPIERRCSACRAHEMGRITGLFCLAKRTAKG